MKLLHKWAIAGGVGAAIIVVAFAPWTFSDAHIRLQLADQVRQATGLETSSAEKITFSLLPRPNIKLRDVVVKDRWGNLNMEVQVLKGNLRFLPLIGGRLEVATLSLFLPTISLNVHARPLHDRGAIAKASATVKSSPQAKAADAARLAAVRIVGGRVLLKGVSDGPVTQIGDVNAVLDWSSISAPATLSGTLIWFGEKVELETRLASPGDLLRAQVSPLKLALKSRLLNLALDGAVSAGAGWQYTGKVSASSSTFRSLLSLSGTLVPFPGGVTSLALNSQINVRPGAASFTDLQLNLEGNKFTGTLAIRSQASRPMISGTLATDNLVIDHRSADLPRLTGQDGRWNDAPLPLRGLLLADLDLRLSAKKASFNTVSAADVAIVALLRDGNLEMSVSSPNAYEGSFQARLGIELGPALPAMTGSLRFEQVNTESFLRSAARSLRFSGKGGGTMTFRSAGKTFAEIAGLVNGDLEAKITAGALAGIDLVEALRLAQSLPLSIPDRIRHGNTPFKLARAKASIKGGKLVFTDAAIESAYMSSDIRGAIDLPSRELNLTIAATAISQSKTSKTAPQRLELDVTGPWSRPAILPNPETLILHSKAAEPLLRTIQKAREAAAARAGAQAQD